jgi:hypothetical protein
MAALTLKQIIDRFQAVMTAAPISMAATREPFSHDLQPANLVSNTYRIEDAGLATTQSASNHAAVRVDTLRVWIARKMAFDGQTALEAVEDTLVAIERAIKTDGAAQSYHAEIKGRDPRRKGDLVIASITFSVDYDFSET